MPKIYFAIFTLLLASCGQNDTRNEQANFFDTIAFDGKAPEGDNLVKQVSPVSNSVSVSWTADEGYSSKVYLSTSEHFQSSLGTSDFEEGVDYITAFEAGEGEDVNINCQVDPSYTVFECVVSGQAFGTSEQIMDQLLRKDEMPMLYLIAHHYQEYDGGSSHYTAAYGLLFSDE